MKNDEKLQQIASECSKTYKITEADGQEFYLPEIFQDEPAVAMSLINEILAAREVIKIVKTLPLNEPDLLKAIAKYDQEIGLLNY